MSTNPRSIQDLEAPEHLRHQRWEWLVERIGWLVIALLLAAAMAGLLGPGPLSDRTAASDDGALTVEYDAFHRYQAPASLRIHVAPRDTESDVKVAVSRSMTDATQLDEIVPKPVLSKLDGAQLILTFRAEDFHQSDTVLYRYQYEKFGSFTHRIGLAGQEPVEIEQWIFP
jgi:anti-sigma factor RsiW